MSKKVIITGVLILLLVAGVGVFLSLNKTNQPQSSTSDDETMQAQETNKDSMDLSQGSLIDLLTSGKAQICTYSSTSNSVNVDGTVYVANKKMRSDFTSTANSTTTNAHIIVDSDYSYFWSDNSSLGIKTPVKQNTPTLSESQDQASMQQSDSDTNASLNQDVSYKCSNWTEDDSKFTLPDNITFTDYSIPTTAPNGTTMDEMNKQSACAVCNSLPSDQQASCKQQLQCE